jgi:hypothetical protein
VKKSNTSFISALSSARCSKAIGSSRRSCIILVFAFCTLISSFPSFGQDRGCEEASQCYAIAFNAKVLAETLREQGEMVSWDEVKGLEEVYYHFMGSVISSCDYSDFSKQVEDYTERDFDRIIEGSRYRSFTDILSQYKIETQACMELFSH